jgi:hypothetical protein
MLIIMSRKLIQIAAQLQATSVRNIKINKE